MKIRVLSIAALILGIGLLFSGSSTALAQEGQPLDLPCTIGVSVAPIGQAMPPDVNGQALAAVRITIAPGGGFTAHSHPGTLIVAIESGDFEYTMLDSNEQTVNRAAYEGTPATTEIATQGTPVTLHAGDWFEEPVGMIHQAMNPGSEPTVVLVAGLVDPSLPFVQCVEDGTPMS